MYGTYIHIVWQKNGGLLWSFFLPSFLSTLGYCCERPSASKAVLYDASVLLPARSVGWLKYGYVFGGSTVYTPPEMMLAGGEYIENTVLGELYCNRKGREAK